MQSDKINLEAIPELPLRMVVITVRNFDGLDIHNRFGLSMACRDLRSLFWALGWARHFGLCFFHISDLRRLFWAKQKIS